jgi:predicted RNase H-like nuclease (RuvC/YqgF family)
MLVKENRQLKQLVEHSKIEMDSLKERTLTLQMLESECHEENEVLKYKVMSMEAELK